MRERQVGEVLVLSFDSASPHETEELEQVHQMVHGALSRGHVRLVVDLDNVEDMKALTLGVLKSAAERCHERGGHLVVCRARPRSLDIFKMTRLDMLFTIRDSEEDAIAYLAKLGRS